ncbi:MAG: hypothetical protein IIX57_02765, partial [Lachnospiraceae bacterium]|nr:hypothetical protein [Lachnospiraceae bacterium]
GLIAQDNHILKVLEVHLGLHHDVLPIRESVILEKSVEFFDDPEPCHIHRGAVRVRLTAEIQLEIENNKDPEIPGPLLKRYANFETIDRCILKD